MNSGEAANWINVVIAFIALLLFIVAERDKFLPFFKRKSESTTPSDNTILAPEKHETIRSIIYTRVLIGLIVSFALSQAIYWTYRKGYIEYDMFDKSKELMFSAGISLFISLFFTIVYIRYSPRAVTFYVHLFERFAISFSLVYYMTQFYYATYYESGLSRVSYNMGATIVIGVLLTLLVSFQYTPIDLVISLIDKLISAKNKSSMRDVLPFSDNRHIEPMPKSERNQQKEE